MRRKNLTMLIGWPNASNSWAAYPSMIQKEIAQKAANVGVVPEQGATLTEMVAEDLMLESQQIETYSALVREIDNQDLVTRQMLIGILAETEKHASELADYLKRTAETK